MSRIEEEVQSWTGECLLTMYEVFEEYQQTSIIKFGSPLRLVAGLFWDKDENELDALELLAFQIPVYREYIWRLLDEREQSGQG